MRRPPWRRRYDAEARPSLPVTTYSGQPTGAGAPGHQIPARCPLAHEPDGAAAGSRWPHLLGHCVGDGGGVPSSGGGTAGRAAPGRDKTLRVSGKAWKAPSPSRTGFSSSHRPSRCWTTSTCTGLSRRQSTRFDPSSGCECSSAGSSGETAVPVGEQDELTFHNTLTQIFNSVRISTRATSSSALLLEPHRLSPLRGGLLATWTTRDAIWSRAWCWPHVRRTRVRSPARSWCTGMGWPSSAPSGQRRLGGGQQ